MSEATLLEVRDLKRHYKIGGGLLSKPKTLKAVDGVSFNLSAGKTLAVVGESGCGKSTLARMVTMIEAPTAGSLKIDGVEVVTANGEALRKLRPVVQMVFQNPYGSLNPRKQVGTILEEPVIINSDLSSEARAAAARAMMAKVGLRPEHYTRYPHMFSGG
ncbi:MAG TPA: ATP-binding cassette domain-containing protein, partial [Dongiaceae bacterium]|nr:ATP-binding cassette domain-containing protein [Dongiaceae bacterium]